MNVETLEDLDWNVFPMLLLEDMEASLECTILPRIIKHVIRVLDFTKLVSNPAPHPTWPIPKWWRDAASTP